MNANQNLEYVDGRFVEKKVSEASSYLGMAIGTRLNIAADFGRIARVYGSDLEYRVWPEPSIPSPPAASASPSSTTPPAAARRAPRCSPACTRDGHPVPPMQGTSLRPAFADHDLSRGQPMFWEHQGNRAARDGDLKLVSTGPESDHGGPATWTRYDLSADRSETRDLAPARPAEVKRLSDLWWQWAASHQVIPNGKGTATRPAE